MKRLALLLPALTLAACSTLPDLPPPDPAAQAAWQAHDQRLATLDHWTLDGRFSLTAGDENWTGTLSWVQAPGDIEIRLSSPMGQGLIALTENAAGATLRMADDRVFHGESGEALFRDIVGWDLPLDTLGRWVLGRPAESREYRLQLSSQGQLTALYQGDWQARYSSYHDVDPPLPRKLELSRRGVRLKLVVDHWSIQDNACSPKEPQATGTQHVPEPVAGPGQAQPPA